MTFSRLPTNQKQARARIKSPRAQDHFDPALDELSPYHLAIQVRSSQNVLALRIVRAGADFDEKTS
jgi:hypothetical protein